MSAADTRSDAVREELRIVCYLFVKLDMIGVVGIVVVVSKDLKEIKYL